jgi:hypothetical protein
MSMWTRKRLISGRNDENKIAVRISISVKRQ